jgi:hypothetical protein
MARVFGQQPEGFLYLWLDAWRYLLVSLFEAVGDD